MTILCVAVPNRQTDVWRKSDTGACSALQDSFKHAIKSANRQTDHRLPLLGDADDHPPSSVMDMHIEQDIVLQIHLFKLLLMLL